MKRIFFTLVGASLLSTFMVKAATLTADASIKPVESSSKVEQATVNRKVVGSKPTSPAKIATATVKPTVKPVVKKIAFDSNNPATWPKCPTGDIVRADNGQCAVPAQPQPAQDNVSSTPAVSTTASTLSTAQTASDCVTGYVSGDYFLDKIIQYESSGNSCATNYLGCFGLMQACPGEPLREACGGNAACQIEWFQANKANGRSWAQIWQHELDYGWW